MEFPIIGPLRLELLFMEWIFVCFSFEIGIIFLIKYQKQPKQLKNTQDLGFSSLFFGFSSLRFFLLIASYYFTDTLVSPFFHWSYGNYRMLLLNFGFLSIMLGILLFSFFMEKYKKLLFKKYFFTYCFIILSSLFLILFFFNLEFMNSLSFLTWPVFTLFFIIYVRNIGRNTRKLEILSKGFLKMISILLLILIGYILSMDIVIYFLGIEIRFVGIIFQLIAICFIFIFFRNIPPFFEFDWQDKIENLYILNKNGICLYYHSFINDRKELDKQFISGSLASMNIMLKELINNQPSEISVVEKKGKILNIFTGSFITGVLISNEELRFFKHNIKKLILKVEDVYKNVLSDWNGDLTIFYPVKNIVIDIFSK